MERDGRQVARKAGEDGQVGEVDHHLAQVKPVVHGAKEQAVDQIAPIHQAQIISYLKLANKSLGLLINFHVPRLKNGIKRFVNGTEWNTRKPL